MAEFSGHLSLTAKRRSNGRTALTEQSFRAPYHLSKPYWDTETETLLVQVVNPTAGILSGDRLESSVAVGEKASLLVTTPSASRVFKMREGSASCAQSFQVARGGWLEVLPEPLVPHRGSSYEQSTHIEVAVGGELFFADLLLPGRMAHGEAWVWNRLVLKTEARIAGELVLRERFDQAGENLKALAALAGSGPEACFGNAILIAEESPLDATWRTEVMGLHGDGLWVGVSALYRGGWSIKFVAKNGVVLRRTLRAIRHALSFRFPKLKCDSRKL